MRRSRMEPEDWRRLVEAQARSGLSLRRFAEAKRISPNTLAYWKYKRAADRQPRRRPVLTPVRVIDDGGGPPWGRGLIEVVLRGGRAIRVQADVDTDCLVRLMTALEQRC